MWICSKGAVPEFGGHWVADGVLAFPSQGSCVTDLEAEPVAHVEVLGGGECVPQFLERLAPVGVSVSGAANLDADPGDQGEAALEGPRCGAAWRSLASSRLKAASLRSRFSGVALACASARSRCSKAVLNAAAAWYRSRAPTSPPSARRPRVVRGRGCRGRSCGVAGGSTRLG